jgi:hypothetical protein
MKRFAPAAQQGLKLQRESGDREIGSSDHLKTDHSLTRSPDPAMYSAMVLRRFRPPLAATVEMRKGEPVHIAARNIRGEMASVSGPWRTSGNWWKGEEKTPRIDTDAHGSNWTRDEWDVSVPSKQGIALYRIYRELKSGAWFVEGSYD